MEQQPMIYNMGWQSFVIYGKPRWVLMCTVLHPMFGFVNIPEYCFDEFTKFVYNLDNFRHYFRISVKEFYGTNDATRFKWLNAALGFNDGYLTATHICQIIECPEEDYWAEFDYLEEIQEEEKEEYIYQHYDQFYDCESNKYIQEIHDEIHEEKEIDEDHP